MIFFFLLCSTFPLKNHCNCLDRSVNVALARSAPETHANALPGPRLGEPAGPKDVRGLGGAAPAGGPRRGRDPLPIEAE